MGACKPFTFQNISRLKFKAIRARIYAQSDRTTILGDTGTAEGFGFKANYSYDEKAQAFTVTCTDKPFFVSENTVRDKLQALVDGVQV